MTDPNVIRKLDHIKKHCYEQAEAFAGEITIPTTNDERLRHKLAGLALTIRQLAEVVEGLV